VVHRALIDLFKLGDGGYAERDAQELDDVANHISSTERKAIAAERSANDRYMALFLSDQVGETHKGRISGVGRFGLFVTLDSTGADGLIPMRQLPDDYYIHDEAAHALVGRRWGRQFRMGEPIVVTIAKTDPLTGIIDLSLHESSPEKFGIAREDQGSRRAKKYQKHSRKGPGKSSSGKPKNKKGPKRSHKGKGTTPKKRR